jgi:threonine dehydratase
VGGGGLLAGVAIAIKALDPRVKVYGAEPEASPTMTAALAAGHIVEIEEEPTIADGCAGNIEPGSITFPMIQSSIDGIILVSEEAIRKAIADVAKEDHLIIEGSAAVSIAALEDERLAGLNTAAIVSGRNLTLNKFVALISNIPE